MCLQTETVNWKHCCYPDIHLFEDYINVNSFDTMFFLFFSASCFAGGSADSFFQSHDPRARPTASDIWHSSHVTTRFSPLQFVYLPWPLRLILQRVSLPWPDLLQVFAFFGAGPSFFIRSLIYDAGRVLRQRAPYAKIIGCWWITLECAIIKQAPRQTQ